jgi:hypothetical protein
LYERVHWCIVVFDGDKAQYMILSVMSYYLTRKNIFDSMNVFFVIIRRSPWLLIYAYHKDAKDLLWLTAVLLCHLQDHKDLCHGWPQRNFNLQQFRNHYYSILNYQICSVLILKRSSVTDLRYLFHTASSVLRYCIRTFQKA